MKKKYFLYTINEFLVRFLVTSVILYVYKN